MDISPSAILTNFVPSLPSIILIGLLAGFGWTANSSHQDALTQIIVAAARPILRTPARIGRSQRTWSQVGRWAGWMMEVVERLGLGFLIGLGGVSWHTVLVRVGDDGETRELSSEEKGTEKVLSVNEAIAFAFDELKDPQHGDGVYPSSNEVVKVEVEWTTSHFKSGKETGVVSSREDPGLQEKEGFLQPNSGDSGTRPVILYLHGGAHCLMDPTTHRWTTGTLSKLSSADVCSVRFRLSPQHPFPAALTDAFVTYLDLISASPTCTQTRINPSRIVFAGDSSGGNLASSLLLLVLTLSRHNVVITFRGQTIRIPSPPCAGLALTSPWLDIVRALPSTSQNDNWDIIAPPPVDSASPPFPRDETWPTNPPRAETYCAADICTHPLVSPLAAKPEQWTGAPPIWMCAGWEGFTDEIEVFARRVYQSSSEAVVWFEGWEGMPHCFGMMPWNSAGWSAMRKWAAFCKDVVTLGTVQRRGTGFWYDRRGARREVEMDKLGCEKEGAGYVRDVELEDEMVDQLMEKGRTWRIGLEEEMIKKWKQGAMYTDGKP